MKLRPLGRSGLQIAPLVFGGNVFGWTADEARSFELLDAFVDLGFNAIDTADIYSNWVPGNQGGESETLIGKWLARSGKRSRVLLLTKVGYAEGLSRKQILSAVEGSLKRLGTDVIDLYQSHREDPSVPLEETLEAYDQLVRAGKVRAIGASQGTPTRFSEALKLSRERALASYTSLQPLYNLYDREDFEKHWAPLCREQGIGVITYYSLAAGFLSGKYRGAADLNKSPRGTRRVEGYLTPRGLKILDALDVVARESGAPVAAVALAWILSNPAVTAPIASATSVAQLHELVQGVELKLSEDALRKLSP